MCTNAKDDVKNALHEVENAVAPITLNYTPYMNWGRWNHNPSRLRPILEACKKNGIAVQLEHSEKETSWEDHGHVELKCPDGNVIVRLEKYQHNRSGGQRKPSADALFAEDGALTKYINSLKSSEQPAVGGEADEAQKEQTVEAEQPVRRSSLEGFASDLFH